LADIAPDRERRPGDALRASSVSRAFEGVQALRDVTLEVRRLVDGVSSACPSDARSRLNGDTQPYGIKGEERALRPSPLASTR